MLVTGKPRGFMRSELDFPSMQVEPMRVCFHKWRGDVIANDVTRDELEYSVIRDSSRSNDDVHSIITQAEKNL